MAAPISYSNPSLTPTDVDGRRKVAQALYGQATDASPVGHWTQAIARVLQGGVSGFYEGTASKGEKEGVASRGAFMQQAMKDPKAAATAGITNPWTTDAAMSMGNTAIQQDFSRSQQANSQQFQRQQQASSQGHSERMANVQHQLNLRLMDAKSEAEKRQLLEQGRALGIIPPAEPYGPPVQPQLPTDMGGYAPPSGQQAPITDPYARLTQPSIPTAQEEAERRKRAGQTLMMGDAKGAAKIMTKDEDPKEYQTKDALWAERMARAEITMRGNIGTPDKPTYNPGSMWNKAWPDNSIFNSEKWRNFQAGSREWIAALLRKDTGAAVTDTEFNMYFPTYFPQPGDSAEVQRQKLDRRVAEARKLRASSNSTFERMNPGFDAEMKERLKQQDQAQGGGGGWSVRRLD